MKYNLFTDVLGDGRIFQSLVTDEKPGTVLGRWVVKTREEGIKEALIELGWTPPKEEE